MTPRLTPVRILIAFLLVGLAITAAVITLAVRQPWLGVSLSPDAEGDVVTIAAVDPAGRLPASFAGATLTRVSRPGGLAVALVAQDVVEESDTLPTYAVIAQFLARQSQLSEILASPQVTLEARAPGGETLNATVAPAPSRPIPSLPAAFWVQISVGLASFLIGGWIWALRRDDLATRLFAIISASILVFTFPAAIYSTRELAIPGDLIRVLSGINHLGALTFGAVMIALLLSYPRRLLPTPIALIPCAVFGLWWLGDIFWLFDGPPMGAQLPTLVEMIGILICAGLQFGKTRGDPRARAVLLWFGLGIMVGAGAFVFTTAAPIVFGAAPILNQGFAFSFFLLIHLGLALGVARYRLFDLDRWAFRVVFYLLGLGLLLGLDAVLVSMVALDQAPGFGLALLAVVFLYLPLRDVLGARLLGHKGEQRDKWFQSVVDVALAPSRDEQSRRWSALLQDVFNPLTLTPGAAVEKPVLVAEGLALAAPAMGDLPALKLEHGYGGRKLFSSRDVTLATELCRMLAHALDSRQAYERGVVEERGRITRDMHDNIGVQLLGALHNPDAARKDSLIRGTITDLRDIINNAAGPDAGLAQVLADLRFEVGEHLASSDIALAWNAEVEDIQLSSSALQALRAIVREAVGNVIKHAGASHVRIALWRDEGALALMIADNGSGLPAERSGGGNGLRNMASRMEGVRGRFEITAENPGTRLEARFPANS